MIRFVPQSPGGTLLKKFDSATESEAWGKVIQSMHLSRHKNKDVLIRGGYDVLRYEKREY